jgi:hypothetical protein
MILSVYGAAVSFGRATQLAEMTIIPGVTGKVRGRECRCR